MIQFHLFTLIPTSWNICDNSNYSSEKSSKFRGFLSIFTLKILTFRTISRRSSRRREGRERRQWRRRGERWGEGLDIGTGHVHWQRREMIGYWSSNKQPNSSTYWLNCTLIRGLLVSNIRVVTVHIFSFAIKLLLSNHFGYVLARIYIFSISDRVGVTKLPPWENQTHQFPSWPSWVNIWIFQTIRRNLAAVIVIVVFLALLAVCLLGGAFYCHGLRATKGRFEELSGV